jgi:glutathione S-transferase
MLKVWGRRSSFNLQKVMWLVGELGLPHEHIPAGGSFGGLDNPAFLAMNPHGRVPVIDDDGTVRSSLNSGQWVRFSIPRG